MNDTTTTRAQSRRTTKKKRQRCYHFGPSGIEGRASDRAVLGGKGANLAEMAAIGLPIPPGFTISTACCEAFQKKGKLPSGLMAEVAGHLRRLEEETGKQIVSTGAPLLLSVRSGAAVSMPGMMDTILNLGLNDRAVEALAEASGDERFAFDAYRRLINMFGEVVMGIPHRRFEKAFDRIKKRYDAAQDTDVPAEGLRALCAKYLRIYEKRVGRPFPQDPTEQLRLSIEAVFSSWDAPRAQTYRRIHNIEGLRGTAVNVQTMVYGNMGPDCATGVAFTRDPASGENLLYGEFLINAQGEDVVAGIRTPRPIAELRENFRKQFKELLEVRRQLEAHFLDMQDLEFTIERGTLFILQTRTGQRTGAAAVRIATDMVHEKLIDRDTALTRVSADDITQLLLPRFSTADKRGAVVLTTGLPASPGAASGAIVLSAEEAVAVAGEGKNVVLVRNDTSPEDVDGMHHARAVVTSTGGMTSHAAVVARGWGKCCVVGAAALSIDTERRTVRVGDTELRAGDVISVDGATGEVFVGELPHTDPTSAEGGLEDLMTWADARARLGVRANADTASDAKKARKLGAKGIGLCRTEHMFFGDKRISAMREMIVANTTTLRRKALAKLLPLQRRDFIGIFKAMEGLPVTIRLLDPPLHEFVPHSRTAQESLAKHMGIPRRILTRRVEALEESNPMLGHRGCRLAITYPEILRMQVTAIVEATIACRKKRIDVHPEIMIPLVAMRAELAMLRKVAEETIAEVKKAKKFRGRLDIPIGTMIEIPRAALRAGEIAEVANFFSFGTNDLTQLTFGFSRDDVNHFLPDYMRHGLLTEDPFAALDQAGVGELVAMATERGRAANPGLKVGVCGEHGGHPASVRFFHHAGLDYVSCSPFRVPIARIAAAQAAIEHLRARSG